VINKFCNLIFAGLKNLNGNWAWFALITSLILLINGDGSYYKWKHWFCIEIRRNHEISNKINIECKFKILI
jgi:hypothetical protein